MISTIVNGFLFSYHADIIKVVFGKSMTTINPDFLFLENRPTFPAKEELFADLLLEMVKKDFISEKEYIEWMDENQGSMHNV